MATRTLIRAAVLSAIAAALSAPSFAQTGGAEYDPDLSPATDYAYEVLLAPRSGPPAAAAIKADLDYVAGMRHHHAGALTMSEEYLADAQARNPVLRRLALAIIPNQKFEIAELDEVKRQVDKPPATLLNLGSRSLVVRPAAVQNLAQRWRFSRASVPTPIDVALAGGPVSERDVQFAKGMSIHHQAALAMAREYNANPDGGNTWLRRLNHDIIVDQQQEIWTMNAVVARYAGDPDTVRVDPSMIHGMEGMAGHGGAHGGAHGSAPGADHGATGATAMPHPTQRDPAETEPAAGHGGHHRH